MTVIINGHETSLMYFFTEGLYSKVAILCRTYLDEEAKRSIDDSLPHRKLYERTLTEHLACLYRVAYCRTANTTVISERSAKRCKALRPSREHDGRSETGSISKRYE